MPTLSGTGIRTIPTAPELRRPSVVLYLGAIALLPWAWFPPFPWVFEHAQWSDVLIAAAAVAWLVEHRPRRWPFRWDLTHTGLALYLGVSGLSLLVSPDRQRGLLLWAGMLELAVLFLLTADLASDPVVRRALVRVVVATSVLGALAALAGLALFYAGHPTRLVGIYGGLVPSDDYARVQAGLYQPNLFGAYCIFAAGVTASPDGGLSRRLRMAVQGLLAVTVVFTLSRTIIGFALAALIRLAARLPFGRWVAVAGTAAAVAAIGALTFVNLSLNPADPTAARVQSDPPFYRESSSSSLETLSRQPVLGAGLGSYPAEVNGAAVQSHMTAIEVAATRGLPALVGLVLVVLGVWRGRRRPTDIAIWSALAGTAVASLALDVQHFRDVWVLLGLAWQPMITGSRAVGARLGGDGQLTSE